MTGVTEHLIQRLHLTGGAGVAVEEEARRGVVLRQPVADDGIGDRVGHVAPRRGDLLHLETEVGLVLDVGAEDVTRGDGGDAVGRGDVDGLGALTGTGRTEHDETHQRRNPS